MSTRRMKAAGAAIITNMRITIMKNIMRAVHAAVMITERMRITGIVMTTMIIMGTTGAAVPADTTTATTRPQRKSCRA